MAVTAVFAYEPQHTESEKNPHERGKTGEHTEYGHKHQTSHTHTQDEHTVRVIDLPGSLVALRSLKLALEIETCTQSRHHHSNKRRSKQLAYHSSGRYHTLDPKHYCSDISDRRKRTTGIGGNNDHSAKQHTVLRISHKFSEHHHHHDTRSEVIKDS